MRILQEVSIPYDFRAQVQEVYMHEKRSLTKEIKSKVASPSEDPILID